MHVSKKRMCMCINPIVHTHGFMPTDTHKHSHTYIKYSFLHNHTSVREKKPSTF